jgi:hypothetical protein
MDIGEAVSALRDGKRIARAGWNGKGMWLAMQGACFSPADKPTTTVQTHDANGNPHRGFSIATMTEPYVFLHTAQGGTIPWNCSQADLLAVDWEISR